MIQKFKEDMMTMYEMFDLGLLHQFRVMRIMQIDTSIFIHQKKYVCSLLSKFGLQDCKTVSTPLVPNEKLRNEDEIGLVDESKYKKIAGSFLYLTATRPDLIYATGLLARFMHSLSNKHLGAARRVLRYVQGTLEYGLEYEKGK